MKISLGENGSTAQPRSSREEEEEGKVGSLEIPSSAFSRGMRGYIGKTRSGVGIFSASWRASSSPWPVFFRRVGGRGRRRMIGRSLESLSPRGWQVQVDLHGAMAGGSAWKCVANGAFFLLMSHPRATKVVPPDDPD